ncbi:MAG: hypothetical protein JNL40_16050 [Cyclobacteriaceae bacterium]|nr:hypothetical protein [Cyclobacteriaceae bacterium]
MRKLSTFILCAVLVSCTNPLPTLEGMDISKWKDDKNGCFGKRQEMEPALTQQMNKLKGLSEMDIVDLLGRPDENELYKRNQKFFSYYVTPGPDCPDPEELPKKLVIRFNAMGYAQLVSLGTARH